MEVPVAHGGQGAGFLGKALIAEELARADMGLAFSLINTQNITARIARRGSPAQIARHLAPLVAGERMGGTSLTEPVAGSDSPAIATTARKIEGGWLLDGEKARLTNAAFAQTMLLYARTDAALGTKGFVAFLIEATPNQEERTLLMTQVNGERPLLTTFYQTATKRHLRWLVINIRPLRRLPNA